MPSLQLLCISGTVVTQCLSRPAAVISSTVFDFDVVFAAITFLAVVDRSKSCMLNSCTLIGRFSSVAIVSCDCVLQYMAVIELAR